MNFFIYILCWGVYYFYLSGKIPEKFAWLDRLISQGFFLYAAYWFFFIWTPNQPSVDELMDALFLKWMFSE